MVAETQRLYLRKMTQEDYAPLCKILQDEEVMYAYEHAFDSTEVQQWLDKQFKSYREYGFGLWAVILKETGEMIGQCGLTMQECGSEQLLEIGYLFQKAFWHQGYATEAAKACKRYAFETLGADAVFSIIRDTNQASRNVALRNGMHICGSMIKQYWNMDMPHTIYCVRRQQEIS